jgi:ATP-dependent RNA helicase DeaD
LNPQKFSKAIPLLLANTTDLGACQNWHRKTAAFDCLFTINRYKLIFDTGACFGSYKGEAADFRNLEDFAKYLPEVSIAATCGGIPIKPQMVWPPTSVATPGRLIDLIQRKVINLKETNFCLRRSR